MHIAVPLFGARAFDGQLGGFGGNALALELRQRAPTDFPHLLALLFPLPINHRARRRIRGRDDDHEDPRMIGLLSFDVLLVALADLLRRFRAAEILGHGRVAHQAFEQWEVLFRPRSQGNQRDCVAGHRNNFIPKM